MSIELFRPSNATHGEFFHEEFCYRCTKFPRSSDAKKQALEILKPPFKFCCGYIFDSAEQTNMVADDGGSPDSLSRVRGWGRLGKLPNGAEVQDAIGEIIAEALNQYFERLKP
ncbi:MAG TPA: hypothetical protein PK011_02690 [Marinagarivorans sp.]|nr:hypothetical protein [Cellvibrionaceae bacterium]HMY38208.1 hypothetical protein [Marinagarivorans sp.]HNG59955.1 hypothetical protein [Cellvibrionaceae bacterium]